MGAVGCRTLKGTLIISSGDPPLVFEQGEISYRKMLPKTGGHTGAGAERESGVGRCHSKSTSNHLCSVPTRFPVQRLAAELLNFTHFISENQSGI